MKQFLICNWSDTWDKVWWYMISKHYDSIVHKPFNSFSAVFTIPKKIMAARLENGIF